MSNQISHTILSKGVVHAQTSVKKPAFNEDISLQFYIKPDYTMTVEGVIELTNTSGKDISLTEYGMNLPYFTLKNTKIGYVYPQAFLVDMYSQNNSILFTFKSQFTKPVVIGKGGKITFSFSAEVEKPYRDFGGLRTLSFPFTLNEEGRSLRITVTVDEKTALIYAPNVATTLKKKNIFTVTDETGKLFLFATSSKPMSITLSHATEVSLPTFGPTNSCSTYMPVSCIGCGNITSFDATKETVAQRQKSAEKVTFEFSKAISPTCAKTKYDTFDLNSAKNTYFRAGFLIMPSANQLIPAIWRIARNGATEYMKDVTTQGVPYVYADALEYLAVPIQTCTTDEDCRKVAEKLSTFDTSISSSNGEESPGITDKLSDTVSVSIQQEGRRFKLVITNTGEKFVSMSPISLKDNSFFRLSDSNTHLLPPKGELTIALDTKSKLQTSNQNSEVTILANNEALTTTFKPITITVLAVIELLAYLFIVSFGIFLFSVFGIILYNRFYEKHKIP